MVKVVASRLLNVGALKTAVYTRMNVWMNCVLYNVTQDFGNGGSSPNVAHKGDQCECRA
jgi:hypothetical protein